MVFAFLADNSLRDMDTEDDVKQQKGDINWSPDSIIQPGAERVSEMSLPAPLGVGTMQQTALAVIVALAGALAVFSAEYAPGSPPDMMQLDLAVPAIASQPLALASIALSSLLVALLAAVEDAEPRQKHRTDKAASLLVAVVGVMCVALLQTPIDIEATEAAAEQAGALDDVFRRAAVFSHFHAGLAWFGDEGILSPEGLA